MDPLKLKRIAVIELFQIGQSPGSVFRQLKSSGYKRDFVYRTLRRYHETGDMNDENHTGRTRSIRTPKLVKMYIHEMENRRSTDPESADSPGRCSDSSGDTPLSVCTLCESQDCNSSDCNNCEAMPTNPFLNTSVQSSRSAKAGARVAIVSRIKSEFSQFKLWIFLIGAISLAIMIFVPLIIVFLMKTDQVMKPKALVHPSKPVPEQCQSIPDERKFDCYPQNGGNQELCEGRGCCWLPRFSHHGSNGAPLNVPFCYYPALYDGYKYVNLSETSFGLTAFLMRKTQSGYPEDIDLLQMDMKYETDSRLHIKIFDPMKKRYEVPIPPVPDVKTAARNPLYLLRISNQSTGFQVLRKSNGEILFDSMDVGSLVFANQFLQLSAILPSSDIYGLDVILQPAPGITFRTVGGILDFYFFLGSSPTEVIQQYTELIGRPFMPPYWSLGFHLCRYGWKTISDTKKAWMQNRDAGIPLDVMWNDLDYMDDSKDFTYNKGTFEGLPEFVEELHSKGYHYVPLIDPGISGAEKPHTYLPFDEGLELDIFIRNSTGDLFYGKVWNPVNTVWVDFTHPKAVSYWTRQLDRYHSQVSFDGAWIDMNEPSNFYSGTINGCPPSSLEHPPYLPGVHGGILYYRTLCMTAKHYSAVHYDVHNIYGFAETVATNFALKEIRKERPFVISRSTYPGQGHYGGHWNGDILSSWHDMAKSISAILNFNMFGIPMVGADICGFNGNTTIPLCQRWMELGAFYPFARNHNSKENMDQDPASLGPEVERSARESLSLRYRLLPYLYTLFWKAHAQGETVARPLFFEFPEDKETYTLEDSFLWGRALLILPVLQENVKEVYRYIPRGWWYMYPEGSRIKSLGSIYTLKAPPGSPPLLLRGGYVIPSQEPGNTTRESRKGDFELFAALNENGTAHGEIYWDDGVSIGAWERGKYNLIKVDVSHQTLLTSIYHWGYETTEMTLGRIFVFGIERTPQLVSIDGKNVAFSYNERLQVVKVTGMKRSLREPLILEWA
ncbi:unnamed protein product [Darwinula stevensoni]|uniref:P-type domain-containing protein n=1 Tax=Darwinula stevensoni TaxID=69355 RepID=A0A7R8X1W5_9CRUS|nr:unnamed protein product [Darwinula stevensoni]CAG0882617.1 unnamed protein product [Darwinula stevensoni]